MWLHGLSVIIIQLVLVPLIVVIVVQVREWPLVHHRISILHRILVNVNAFPRSRTVRS